jgi:uncharacterized small protein (DUF1192 family)
MSEAGFNVLPGDGKEVLPDPTPKALNDLDVRGLINAVHALRKAPAAERDWNVFAALMRQLCRARAAMVISWSPQPRILGQDLRQLQWQPAQEAGFVEVHGRAMQNGHAYGPSMAASGKPYLLVLVRVFGLTDTMLMLYLDEQQRPQVNEMVLRAMLAADFSGSAPSAQPISDTLADMIDLSAEVMAQTSFSAAALSLVNGVTLKLAVVYATLGWIDDTRGVRTVAISQLDRFDRKSQQVQLIEEVFEEVRVQDHEMWESADGGAVNPDTPLAQFASERGCRQVCALPMRDARGKMHAVLLCVFSDEIAEPPDMGPLLLSLDLMQPRLADLHWQQQGWPRRAGAGIRHAAAAVLGPEHVWAKLAGLLALVLLAYLFLGTWQHRIDASAQITTDSTRLVSAQYDGRVDKVLVTSGDLVKAGDVLLELDVRELRQQDAELQAEIRRIEAEVGKYRASESLSEMEIAQARLDQSLARRDRVAQYIAQSTALAPFDGVVVEGERKELLGAPVRKGEMLLRVAKVEDLYVTLLVAERDVRDVRPDAIGELLLLSHPDVAIAIQVTAIIPVAQLKGQEGNHFMVRAKLLQQPEPWWRPGMTGLGRIDVGERRVIWILTHKLIDNLRLMFWW